MIINFIKCVAIPVYNAKRILIHMLLDVLYFSVKKTNKSKTKENIATYVSEYKRIR